MPIKKDHREELFIVDVDYTLALKIFLPEGVRDGLQQNTRLNEVVQTQLASG